MHIFVTGPYGSGISAVVRLVQCCGFYSGEPHELLTSPSDNSLGSLEARWLVDFNDELLWCFGVHWNSAARLDLDTLPASLREWLHQRATTWAARMAQYGNWVCTDRRLCFTAGFWLQVLPETLVVFCLGHPRQAVASMMQCQQCPFPNPAAALAAWRRSFYSAVMETRGKPRFVLDYGRLLTDPAEETARLVAFCRTHAPNYAPPADLQEQISSNLVPYLRDQLAENLPDISCDTRDIEGYEALLADDQAGLNRVLQTCSAPPLVFDINHAMQGHRRQMAAQEQLRHQRLAEQDHLLATQLTNTDRAMRALESRLAWFETTLADKERSMAHLETHQHHLTLLQQLTEQEVRSLKRSWSYRVGRVIVWPGSLLKMAYHCLQRLNTISLRPPTAETRAELTAKYERLAMRPLFSIVTPVYNTPAPVLRETLESVCNQVYQEWELCLVDDGSTRQETLHVLAEFQAREPHRIKCARLPGNSGIAVASNTAARLATGSFLALLDHDDLLTPDALLEVALRLEHAPETDMLYSDEDKVTMTGALVQPFYKPDFSPELLLTNNYLCHFSVIRATVFWDVGGFHEGVDGSQDFDLFLRVTEVAQGVEHIPKILYHWRMVPGSAAVDIAAKGGPWRESSRQALRAAIARRSWKAQVLDGLLPSTYRVKFAVDSSERVTIIIPTKDKVKLLQACIESICQHTDHPSYEILVISNNSQEEETYAYLEGAMREGILRFLRHDIPFNYAALNNFAVRHCDSPYLLFLNNDIEVASAEWLTSMLEFAQHTAIGAVGAKLLYPDNTIQHAGVILGLKGIAGHSHRHVPADSPGYFGHLNVIRNYSAVTAACLLTRREVFEAVGGFNEDLAVAFGDVDFCLEVRTAGYRIVYTPYARLYHYESASRGSDSTPENAGRFRAEIAYMLAKWGPWLHNDPYYNPNLTLWRDGFSLKTPADAAKMQAFLGSVPSLAHSIRQRVPTT